MFASMATRVRALLTDRLSPGQFRLVSLAAVVAIVLTIVSGAAVRLTGSGLGCSDWPSCTSTQVIAPLQIHAWVEFGNRLINALVTVASIGAFLAAVARTPRRRDLSLLAGGLVVGLLAEVGIGAVVVYSKLAPTIVSIHFLVGLALLADSVVLHQRAGIADGRERSPMVGSAQIWMARALLLAAAVVVILGTVVTSTGPHGGSPSAKRFGFSLHSVAQLHGTSAEVFLGLTLLTLWSLVRTKAPPPVMRRAEVLLLAIIAQAAVGYSQYLSRDPAVLVAFHVLGASLLVVAVLRFQLGLCSYETASPPASVPAPPRSGEPEPALSP